MYLRILRLFTVTNCAVTLSIFHHFIITPDELKDEQQTWISKVAALNEKTENLLGDALVSAAYICILPPFNKTSRWDIIKLHYAIELYVQYFLHRSLCGVQYFMLSFQGVLAKLH